MLTIDKITDFFVLLTILAKNLIQSLIKKLFKNNLLLL